MLTFGIRYLTGSVVASDVADRRRVEWPPHPGRVFMALAAAHFQTGDDPAERKALEWLESLPAPSLASSPCEERAAVTVFVPVNDKAGPSNAPLQSAPALTRGRQPRTFARAWLEDETVWLCWRDADASPYLLALSALTSKVTRIGHSSSLVQMWTTDQAPDREPTLVPSDHSTQHLRVPGIGSLEDLERRFNRDEAETFADLKLETEDGDGEAKRRAAKKTIKERFDDTPPVRLRPEMSLAVGYSTPEEAAPAAAGGTVFDHRFIVFSLERDDGPYRHLNLAATLQLTDQVRKALLSLLPPNAPLVLTGHGPDGASRAETAHLALFPLPFVGREHAHGGIIGLGLSLPKAATVTDKQMLLAALRTLQRDGLVMGRLGKWQLSPPENQLTLKPTIWTAAPEGSTRWATVTPYVYDRHSKAKDKAVYHRELEESIQLAWSRVAPDQSHNIPRVIITPVSAHLGAPAAHEYPRLQRKDGSQLRHCHAILDFAEPVCGPLLLGAGRYRGYGLCRPM